jgi:hypothetical protein
MSDQHRGLESRLDEDPKQEGLVIGALPRGNADGKPSQRHHERAQQLNDLRVQIELSAQAAVACKRLRY